MKPSDFPRDRKFLDPRTPPFLETYGDQNVAHVFSYADTRRVQLDPDGEFSHDATAYLPPGQPHIVWYFMWATDPGVHGRHDPLRGLVEGWFRRRAVAAMAPRVQAYARDLRAEIVRRGTGTVDLATDFAYPLSLRTICGLVGIPLEREDWLRHELELAVRPPDPTRLEVRHNVESYLWELIAKRLVTPQDELLDVLIAGWAAGTITDRELLGFIWGFGSAGTDTTGTGIVNAVALAAEVGELDYLRDHLEDDAALALAVDETLRFSPPFPTTLATFSTKPVRFGELEVPPYSRVLAHLAAANRSPEINGSNAAAADPNIVDLRRSPNRHVGFGVGVHHCLGATLARMEIATALRELLTNLPGLALDDTKPFRRYAGVVDGVAEAHFTFDQEKAEQLLR